MTDTQTVVDKDICGRCRRPMVSQPVWRENPEHWKAKGYVRRNGRGRCNGCYAAARRSQNLPPRNQPPKLTIETRFTVSCEVCGPITTVASRPDAVKERAAHLATAHGVRPSSRSRRTQLTDTEVARLRAAVGLAGAA